MNPLEIYLIDLIEDEKKESQFEEEKVSSSSQRMRLLGTGAKIVTEISKCFCLIRDRSESITLYKTSLTSFAVLFDLIVV